MQTYPGEHYQAVYNLSAHVHYSTRCHSVLLHPQKHLFLKLLKQPVYLTSLLNEMLPWQQMSSAATTAAITVVEEMTSKLLQMLFCTEENYVIQAVPCIFLFFLTKLCNSESQRNWQNYCNYATMNLTFKSTKYTIFVQSSYEYLNGPNSPFNSHFPFLSFKRYSTINFALQKYSNFVTLSKRANSSYDIYNYNLYCIVGNKLPLRSLRTWFLKLLFFFSAQSINCTCSYTYEW